MIKGRGDYKKTANFILVKVDTKYCDYLREYDFKVSYKRKSDKLYHKLLQEQLLWFNSNKKQVTNKAIKLYQLYTLNKLSDNIKNRCCNYKLLEEKCIEYNSVLV